MRKYLATFCVLCVLCGAALSVSPLRIGTAMPSLTFTGATSDRVDVSGVASSDAFTFWAWIYPTAFTHNRFIVGANTTPVTYGRRCQIKSTFPTNGFNCHVDRATTVAEVDSTDNAVTANAWNFVALTFDGTNAPAVFRGTLTSAVVDVTGFTDAGSGSVSALSGNFRIGNTYGTPVNLAFPGHIAVVGWHTRALTLAELRLLQFQPMASAALNSELLFQLGWGGTGTQADLSGNGNNGTVTGATVVAHAPIARWP